MLVKDQYAISHFLRIAPTYDYPYSLMKKNDFDMLPQELIYEVSFTKIK